jgi:hypothetical protein
MLYNRRSTEPRRLHDVQILVVLAILVLALLVLALLALLVLAILAVLAHLVRLLHAVRSRMADLAHRIFPPLVVDRMDGRKPRNQEVVAPRLLAEVSKEEPAAETLTKNQLKKARRLAARETVTSQAVAPVVVEEANPAEAAITMVLADSILGRGDGDTGNGVQAEGQ